MNPSVKAVEISLPKNDLIIFFYGIVGFFLLPIRVKSFTSERDKPNGFIPTPKDYWLFMNISCEGDNIEDKSLASDILQQREGLFDEIFPKRRKNKKKRKKHRRKKDLQPTSSTANEYEKNDSAIFTSILFGDQNEKKDGKTNNFWSKSENSNAKVQISVSEDHIERGINGTLIIDENVISGAKHIHVVIDCPLSILSKNAVHPSVTDLIITSNGVVSLREETIQDNNGNLTYLKLWSSKLINISTQCSWLPSSVKNLDLSHSVLKNINFTNCELNIESLSIAGDALESLDICFTTLTILDASWNKLKNGSINCDSGADTVRELDLSHNYLENWSTCYWPKTTQVNLEYNTISQLDTSCMSSSLLDLNAAHNHLKHTPAPLPPKLLRMDLSHNRIGFVNSVEGAIQTLLLSHNQLTSLKKGTFQYSWQLLELDLSFNKFEVIYGYYFTGLQELRSLDLSHNHIQSINYEAFRPLRKLQRLRLFKNKLRQLDARLIYELPKGLHFVAHDNPWRCSCHLLSSLSRASRAHCKNTKSCRSHKLKCREGKAHLPIEEILKDCLKATEEISIIKSQNVIPSSDEDISEEKLDTEFPAMAILGIFLIISIPIIAMLIRKVFIKKKILRKKNCCNCLSPETTETTRMGNHSLAPRWNTAPNGSVIIEDSDSETEL